MNVNAVTVQTKVIVNESEITQFVGVVARVAVIVTVYTPTFSASDYIAILKNQPWLSLSHVSFVTDAPFFAYVNTQDYVITVQEESP